MMQFRDIVFHPDGKDFYNAGGMVQSVSDLEAFATRLGKGEFPRLRLLIVGIDFWWLALIRQSSCCTKPPSIPLLDLGTPWEA